MDNDGRLSFVVAWGHKGAKFTNRQGPLEGIMGPITWMKEMDLRLRGAHNRELCRLAVQDGGNADVADWASSILMPPVAQVVTPGGGAEPARRLFASFTTDGLQPLSVRAVDEGRIVIRLVDTIDEKRRFAGLKLEGWRVAEVRNLDGQPVKQIGPGKIVEIELEKA